MAEFHFQAAGATDRGQVRPTNQDAFAISEDQRFYIVADGMGGHAGGEIASQLCVQEIGDFLQAKLPKALQQAESVERYLEAAINRASMRIYEKALEQPHLKGMGTTATVLACVGGRAYWGHVGDSRLYLLRCGLLYQLTHDHSLVSEQLRAGLITEEEASVHHLRNVITRSVGYQEEEEVDVDSMGVEEGDIFLLCSDGLHGRVSDTEISQILQRSGTACTDELIHLANQRGGEDNITAVIVTVDACHT